MARGRILHLLLPALALLGSGLATWSIASQPGLPARAEPPAAPPRNPYPAAVAGLGQVEPRSEVIRIGNDTAGLVARVEVRPGQRVAAGEALLHLDDRRQRAALEEAEAALVVGRAGVRSAEARLADALAEQRRAALDADRYRDLARSEVASSRQRFEAAEAAARRADAAVELARAGIAAAEAALGQARASVARARVELDKTVLRAPIDGTVLAVHARPGEHAQPGAEQPLLELGDLAVLHVRVQLDEIDAPRLEPSAAASAFLRGDGSRSAPLAFVRLEPLARAKRFLSNAPGERVDTRVVEALYRLEPDALPVQVGQMLDVFVAAEPRPAPLAAH